MYASELRDEKKEIDRIKHEKWIESKYEEIMAEDNGHHVDFTSWKNEVERIFMRDVGCSWNDLCGDDDFLLRNLDLSPEDFVEWVNKHGLIRIC